MNRTPFYKDVKNEHKPIANMTEDDKTSNRKTFPSLGKIELETAAANLDAYLELAWEVFEEMAVENKGKPRKPKKHVDSIYREFDSS